MTMTYPRELYDRLPDLTNFVRRMGHRISLGDWVEKRRVVRARCHDENCNRSFFVIFNTFYGGKSPTLVVYEGTDTYYPNNQNMVVTFSHLDKIPHPNSSQQKFFCKRYQVLI